MLGAGVCVSPQSHAYATVVKKDDWCPQHAIDTTVVSITQKPRDDHAQTHPSRQV